MKNTACFSRLGEMLEYKNIDILLLLVLMAWL